MLRPDSLTQDQLEAAACAGDSAKAYEALHLASCALLPDAAGAGGGGAEAGEDGGDGGGDLRRRARLAAAALQPWRVLARVVLRGASLLERERRYEDAVHYLQILLHCPAIAHCGTRGARGEALVRLVTDLEHLNRPTEALEAAEAAVAQITSAAACCAADVALCKAVARLAAPPRRWKRPALPVLLEPPEVTVAIPRDARAAGRAAWALSQHRAPAGDDDAEGEEGSQAAASSGGGGGGGGGAGMMRRSGSAGDAAEEGASGGATVEHAVLAHYARDGWRGAHTENGPFVTLFTLLLWDALFATGGGGGGAAASRVHPAALTPLADAPLDLCRPLGCRTAAGELAAAGADASWRGRASARLAELAAATPEAVASEVAARLADAAGMQARGVCPPASAALSAADLAEVAGALGGKVLSGIFEAFLSDYDGAACGFPDLLLWRPGAGVARLVEVKGPGDKLSGRQIATLHRLLAAGADCWVCYVVDGNGNGGGGGGRGSTGGGPSTSSGGAMKRSMSSGGGGGSARD